MSALKLATYEERYVSRLSKRTAAAQPSFIPKLVCKPSRGQDTLKVGIFAGLHGDEQAGIDAAYELLRWAWNDPEELQDYELHLYPICNPSGHRLQTRHSWRDLDLNREFWSGSQEPEVVYLESELRREKYDAIIALHTDDEQDGLYGFVSGTILSEEVLQPALQAASKILPLNNHHLIDGFLAKSGIIKEGYQGVLSAPPEQRPKAMEIVFETPGHAPLEKQVAATVIAVKTILAEYRLLHAYAPNL
ncbi:succinylglutamate desuccinylase/aspartoacylase family protein [Verrucomicrobium sp. BvORR034]|jgi:protein MpaA|uniref:succinylglutamate desuccinylase/aspartoacylase domain-containing protein n=1 Tax=Verrucomicrobium sp. BvORR034 TaxID=1396418 RepID=UPI0006794617|nr:succinylglutamate desuccinylase/aspartoacylase family protein [Verrucomicrobium sp. BvORR034]